MPTRTPTWASPCTTKIGTRKREFMEYSPGWVLLAHQIRWAIEQGRNEFDFMRGDEDYKYRFGASNQYVMRVQVSPA